MRIEFVVPGAPQPKQRARVFRGGAYTPIATRNYERLVAQTARVAYCCRKVDLSGNWAASIRAYFADSRRRDADNVAKTILDGITRCASFWRDDSQVRDLRVQMLTDRKRPRAEVCLERLQS